MTDRVPITAGILYDLVHCPHRVTMDRYAPAAERDPVSPFTQLLWEKGTQYEREVIESLENPCLDLSEYSGDENTRLTLEAMRRGEPLIYSGRIEADGLLGIPDLMRWEGEGYVPGDIKSGSAEEGPEDNRKLKAHYGVQLALYVDVLEQLDLSAGRRGFIWNVHGEEVTYDLTAPKGARTPGSLWDDYQAALAEIEQILRNHTATTPAYSSLCKGCHWYSSCLKKLEAGRDLTLIPDLGRMVRDAIVGEMPDISALAGADPDAFIRGRKTVFPKLGLDRLRRFHARAQIIQAGGAPYVQEPFELPELDWEIFFDLEFDPMRDLCYLHGFLERSGRDNETERFVYFFANDATGEAERQTFADAIDYVRSAQPCALYFYSKYERTIYRKLCRRHLNVATEAEIDDLFDPTRAVDLYDLVKKYTEWPTWDHSIKTLADTSASNGGTRIRRAPPQSSGSTAGFKPPTPKSVTASSPITSTTAARRGFCWIACESCRSQACSDTTKESLASWASCFYV